MRKGQQVRVTERSMKNIPETQLHQISVRLAILAERLKTSNSKKLLQLRRRLEDKMYLLMISK